MVGVEVGNDRLACDIAVSQLVGFEDLDERLMSGQFQPRLANHE